MIRLLGINTQTQRYLHSLIKLARPHPLRERLLQTLKRFDRGRMEQTLAGLGSRVFLMSNVHEEEPVVFPRVFYFRG